MKKSVYLLLGLVMAMSFLAGCGGETDTPDSSTKAESKETTAAASKETTPVKPELQEGYWAAESMIMEGVEFSGKDMTEIFGPADSIASFGFDKDGTLNGIVFGEFLKGTYTGNTDKFEGEFQGEKLSGGWTDDGKLKFEFGADSCFILVNQSEMPEALAANPWLTYQIEFDGQQTAAMSNFMVCGRYYIEDGVLYGLTHKGNLNGALGATPFEMVGDFPEFGETVVLADEYAVYLCKNEDYLYYIRNYEAICRIHMDGSGHEVLYEGSCDYLQIHEGKIYFTDENYCYMSMELDGSDVTTVVDKEIYYPYFIASDWMIFQDDADDESLHLYNTTHGTELNITYVPSYNPILDGHYLYYTDVVDGGYNMVRIDMSDPELFLAEAGDNILMFTDFTIDNTTVYIPNGVNKPKEEWKDLTDDRTDFAEQEVYVSDEYIIYHRLDEEGLITSKTLMSKIKFGGTSFE